MDTPKTNNASGISKEAEAQSKPSRRISRRERSGSDTGANEPYLPGRNLRYTSADLTQAELRLRRLESFVTSNQYELHKELTKIEREGDKQHVP